MDTAGLYQIAQDELIPIIEFNLPECGSLCIQSDYQRCYIGMDIELSQHETECRVHLAHELGHCCTGSFYNRYAACDIRQKHENRADKWAVQHLIPEEELDEAIALGYTDIWALSEYFDVTPDFMRKAVCWYTYGNLASDLYF